MERTCSSSTGIYDAVILWPTREGYASRWLQSHDQIVRWAGSDVGNAEVHGDVFARIDNAVARRAAFGRNSCAAISQDRQLPPWNTDLPDASSVSGDAQVTLDVGNLHIEDGNAWQARTQW